MKAATITTLLAVSACAVPNQEIPRLEPGIYKTTGSLEHRKLAIDINGDCLKLSPEQPCAVWRDDGKALIAARYGHLIDNCREVEEYEFVPVSATEFFALVDIRCKDEDRIRRHWVMHGYLERDEVDG